MSEFGTPVETHPNGRFAAAKPQETGCPFIPFYRGRFPRHVNPAKSGIGGGLHRQSTLAEMLVELVGGSRARQGRFGRGGTGWIPIHGGFLSVLHVDVRISDSV